jgi:hypothetical protein
MDVNIHHIPVIVNVFTYISLLPYSYIKKKRNNTDDISVIIDGITLIFFPIQNNNKKIDTDTDDDENDSRLSFYAADPFSLFEIPMLCASFVVG